MERLSREEVEAMITELDTLIFYEETCEYDSFDLLKHDKIADALRKEVVRQHKEIKELPCWKLIGKEVLVENGMNFSYNEVFIPLKKIKSDPLYFNPAFQKLFKELSEKLGFEPWWVKIEGHDASTITSLVFEGNLGIGREHRYQVSI